MPRLGTDRASARIVALAALLGCTPASEPSPGKSEPPRRVDTPATTVVTAQPLLTAVATVAAAPTSIATVAATGSAVATPAPAQGDRYPWLSDSSIQAPAVAGVLEDRIAPPAGFTRVALAADSFGAWLRRLPLTAEGTPVKSNRGAIILPPDHENLAAVVALDVGAGDLQQCADSVIRLHAEWLWSRGRRDQSYRAASGMPLPFARWAGGERVQNDGASIRWAGAKKADSSHAAFRAWLDAVFAWANTGSLARDTGAVALADLRPGDFVVQPGGPGHAVLVLDLATSPDGRRALLLGQGFMPAQSFQVLRPSRVSPWFLVDEQGLTTPFWPTFAWSRLHRFEGS